MAKSAPDVEKLETYLSMRRERLVLQNACRIGNWDPKSITRNDSFYNSSQSTDLQAKNLNAQISSTWKLAREMYLPKSAEEFFPMMYTNLYLPKSCQ